jgi:hypothetical protein
VSQSRLGRRQVVATSLYKREMVRQN